MTIKTTITPNLLTILGPTASGKTRLAVALAEKLGAEIISADSRQVFKGMDIGSGKDLCEYGQIPYHLIDILDAGSEFSVFEFQRKFMDAFTEIIERNLRPILCGGSGMYLDSVLRGYSMIEVPRNEFLRYELSLKSDLELSELLCSLKPEQHNKTDLTNRERTVRAIEIAIGEVAKPFESKPLARLASTVIGIRWERNILKQRITKRLKDRLDNGMIEEVDNLHKSGIEWARLSYYGLEYRYVSEYLQGSLNKNDMFQKLNSAIHDFAKKQMNWFRRMESHGIIINWIDGESDLLAQALKII